MIHSLKHEVSLPEGACLCVLGITQNIILESTSQTQCQCELTLCSLTVTGGSGHKLLSRDKRLVMINLISMSQCKLGSFKSFRTISSINNVRLVMVGWVTKLVSNQSVFIELE
eukprot:5103454-Amphidinium_carterae.1